MIRVNFDIVLLEWLNNTLDKFVAHRAAAEFNFPPHIKAEYMKICKKNEEAGTEFFFLGGNSRLPRTIGAVEFFMP